MPRHVLTLLAVNTLFFILLWLAVVVFDLPTGRAVALVFLTLLLIGAGALYSTATLAGDRDRDNPRGGNGGRR